MSKKLNAIITLLSLPLTLASLQALARPAEAEEISVGIAPTLTEITAQGGETLETTILVKNNADASATFTTLLQPFTASGQENGAVRYFEATPDIFRTIQVFSERERINELTLKPHEEKSLTMRIHIPESQTSHDYYFSLVLLSKPVPLESALPQEGIRASSELSGGVAAHFLVSVNPESRAEVTVAEFATPPLNQQPLVPVTVRVSNLGTNFTKVSGEVTVNSIFGTVEKISVPETTILSQSTRALIDPRRTQKSGISPDRLLSPGIKGQRETNTLWLDKPLLPGIYQAHLSLKNQTDNQTLSQTIYFAVAPLQLIIGLLITGVLLYLIKRRIQKQFS